MMELGRAVRRADDEGHPTLMRLHHRRMELRGGGATRDADDGGRAGRHGEADGEETGTPLVQADVHPEPGGQRRAIGVEREPGHTTASVTPPLTHSSTRVAAKVACTLTWRAPPCRTTRHRPALGAAARLHADGAPVGPLRGDRWPRTTP